MRLKDLALAVAKQLGWNGSPWIPDQKSDPADYYQFVIDNLPKMTLGDTQPNRLIDKIADSMGWNEDDRDRYKTRENFVWHNFEQAYSHYLEVGKRFQEMEQTVIPIQVELEKIKQEQTELLRQIEVAKLEIDAANKRYEELQIENALLKDASSQAKSEAPPGGTL